MENCIPDTLIYVDTIKRIIADSVTIRALEASQQFYSSSFNCILIVITICIGLSTIFLMYYNSQAKKNLKKELANDLTKEIEKVKENLKPKIIEDLKPEILKIRNISYFTDPRDMQTYRTVKIGTQTWMAENLNFNANGSVFYANNSDNAKKYGRLYDWKTAKNACPKGWHLPSNDEWQILINLAGDDSVAGEKLKAISGWNGKSGTDEFYFTALPGGLFNLDANCPINLGYKGVWWTSTEINSDEIFSRGIDHNGNYVYQGTEKHKSMLSIRCIKD